MDTPLPSQLKIKKPKRVAGGPRAVLSTLGVTLGNMGAKRTFKTLGRVNQKVGFDCPGCAWPEPDTPSHFEFCENGAKAIAAEATTQRIERDFFRRYSISQLGHQPDHWLEAQGRLCEPLLLRENSQHYEPISWQEGISVVASELRRLSSPHEAVFYTSGRTSNEAAFLYQLFARFFGTNNLPDCSNLCHESSGVALSETIGSGKGTVLLDDFKHSDCIIVIGQNPGTNHPRMLTTLQGAARRGCPIVSINPLPEAGLVSFRHPQELSGWLGKATPLSSHYLNVRINGDVALLKGIMKELVATGSFDRKFIADHTLEFESFARDLKGESWEKIVESTGLTRESISSVTKVIGQSKRLIVCWAMGLTQHQNAVANIQEIVNLLLLGGHFGKRGAGACPVRGHSNVQGDRTMGIWENPSLDFLNTLSSEFSFSPPRGAGFNVVSSIKAMHDGRAKVFFALGGNFLSASPDTEFTSVALKRCSLTAHVSTKLNRSHLTTGRKALILPCLGRTEIDIQESGPQFVSVEDSMGMVHSSKGVLPPASHELKSEVAIVCDLAKATLGQTLNWEAFKNDYGTIRDSISRVIPGFENYNQKIMNGFSLPHAVRDHLEFKTKSGKAHFTVHPLPPPIPERHFLLMTIRSHDQYNTTIYGLNDRYRGISGGRRVVFINEGDMLSFGFKRGEKVDLISYHQGETRKCVNFELVAYPIPRQCLACYFPEANGLVHINRSADKSHTPASKSLVVTLQKHEPSPSR